MMKGLFNYESAYREYTRSCLQHFVDNNVQYAEIRPNFMKTNYILHDTGAVPAGEPPRDNRYIMDLIREECTGFMTGLEDRKKFLGIKVIYCTPRSFTREDVAASLDECLRFKLDWPDYIAGFDLVGEEDVPRWPLSHFTKEFLEFKEKCREAGVDIPFLFHCGETLEIDGQTDGNLVDALLLGSKRIGHGFALARHPYLVSEFKKRNICLEICPISNEVLGLTPRINGHSMYTLLASNVHCTINSDNATLYK
jgi:adenosine deaminase CECR1